MQPSVQPVRSEIKIIFAFSKELRPSMQYEASSLSINVELNLDSWNQSQKVQLS